MRIINLTVLLGALFISNPLTVSNCLASPLEDVASPVSNPVNFEDPRIESNLRAIYVHHDIDNSFVTGGGAVDIYALQARYAITEDLAIIATKDGWVNFRPNSVLNDGSGTANIAGGLKYSFYKTENFISTAGLRYEAPTGEHEALQGEGDGIFNPFISAAVVAGPLNLVGYTGLRIPVDDSDSSFYDVSLHADSKIGIFSPLIELNMFHVISGGDRLPIADEGQDFFNLGSANAGGETMLTGAAGARVELTKQISFGSAYEIPIISDSGSYITEWSATSDLTYKF